MYHQHNSVISWWFQLEDLDFKMKWNTNTEKMRLNCHLLIIVFLKKLGKSTEKLLELGYQNLHVFDIRNKTWRIRTWSINTRDVCMRVCTCLCACVSLYTCVPVCVCLCIYIYTCMHVWYVCMYVCLWLCRWNRKQNCERRKRNSKALGQEKPCCTWRTESAQEDGRCWSRENSRTWGLRGRQKPGHVAFYKTLKESEFCSKWNSDELLAGKWHM